MFTGYSVDDVRLQIRQFDVGYARSRQGRRKRFDFVAGVVRKFRECPSRFVVCTV